MQVRESLREAVALSKAFKQSQPLGELARHEAERNAKAANRGRMVAGDKLGMGKSGELSKSSFASPGKFCNRERKAEVARAS